MTTSTMSSDIKRLNNAIQINSRDWSATRSDFIQTNDDNESCNFILLLNAAPSSNHFHSLFNNLLLSLFLLHFFHFFRSSFFICFHCNFLRSHCLFSLHFIFAFDLMPLHPLRLTGPAINMKLNRLHIAQSTKRRRMANGKMSHRHRSNRTKETEKTEKRVTSHWRRCRSTFESSRK